MKFEEVYGRVRGRVLSQEKAAEILGILVRTSRRWQGALSTTTTTCPLGCSRLLKSGEEGGLGIAVMWESTNSRARDPSRPRADDREIGLKGLVLLNIGSIDHHDHLHRGQILGAAQGPPNTGKGGKGLQPATAHGPGSDTESRLYRMAAGEKKEPLFIQRGTAARAAGARCNEGTSSAG